jgi:hypothetical protein
MFDQGRENRLLRHGSKIGLDTVSCFWQNTQPDLCLSNAIVRKGIAGAIALIFGMRFWCETYLELVHLPQVTLM